jgi:hypothetical protein
VGNLFGTSSLAILLVDLLLSLVLIENPHGALLACDHTVDAFFAIDITLTFFVAYLDKRMFMLVDNLKKIAFRKAVILWKQLKI